MAQVSRKCVSLVGHLIYNREWIRKAKFSQLDPMCRSLHLLSSLNRDDKRECGGANKGNASEGVSVQLLLLLSSVRPTNP